MAVTINTTMKFFGSLNANPVKSAREIKTRNIVVQGQPQARQGLGWSGFDIRNFINEAQTNVNTVTDIKADKAKKG